MSKYQLTISFDTTMSPGSPKRGVIIATDKKELLDHIANAVEAFNSTSDEKESTSWAFGDLIIDMNYILSMSFWIQTYEVMDGHEKTAPLLKEEANRLIHEGTELYNARQEKQSDKKEDADD